MQEFIYQVFGIKYNSEGKGWQAIPNGEWSSYSNAELFARLSSKSGSGWSDVCIKKTNLITGEVQTIMIKSKGVIQNA